MILFDDQDTHEARGRGASPRPRASIEPAKIKVIGVGGGGGNAVNRMIDAQLRGIEFIAANTDLQALAQVPRADQAADRRQLTKGLGAGADPEIGRKAALEDTERILEMPRRAPTWSSSPPAWAAAPAPARCR